MMEEYLTQGLALGIFPEGTRSQNAALIPALNGTALIAQRTGAPILPLGIYGTERMRGLAWYFKRPIIIIRYGEPFHLPSGNSKLERETATRYIMERIAELLPAEYHGAYTKQDNK